MHPEQSGCEIFDKSRLPSERKSRTFRIPRRSASVANGSTKVSAQTPAEGVQYSGSLTPYQWQKQRADMQRRRCLYAQRENYISALDIDCEGHHITVRDVPRRFEHIHLGLRACALSTAGCLHNAHDGASVPLDEPLAAGAEPSAVLQTRDTLLLPARTRNLLCNWSPVSHTKISVLLDVLREVWDPLTTPERCLFYDLGCGDGRVVLEVCNAFPNCRGVGIDLNSKVVDRARTSAKHRGLEKQCEFLVGDIMSSSIREASVIFLYLPAAALTHLLRTLFPKAGLRVGTIFFTADGPFPAEGSHAFSRFTSHGTWWWEKLGLHCYVWQGCS